MKKLLTLILCGVLLLCLFGCTETPPAETDSQGSDSDFTAGNSESDVSDSSDAPMPETVTGDVFSYRCEEYVTVYRDDGRLFGFVLAEDTELIWTEEAKEGLRRTPWNELGWEVLSGPATRITLSGLTQASAPATYTGSIAEWYRAESVTVLSAMDLIAAPEKPVIYLYPEVETEVSVLLDYRGTLTYTYPAYGDGWRVTAKPDGTLTDADGQIYNYLYWEGIGAVSYDFSEGFCVAGKDVAAFLEDALARLGLTRREANEFIVYWLPQMEQNPYNLISFQQEAYTESAPLTVTPAPDTLIRVFMAYQPLEMPVEIEPQSLSAPVRTGFTVVEWGGAEVK